MAIEQEGIMSLPQGGADQAPAPGMYTDEAYDAVREGLEGASPLANADMQGALDSIVPMLDELTDEQLDAFIQLFQYMLERPDEYAQTLQESIKEDIIEPDTLPEEHDPEILSAILVVLVDARRQRQMGNQRASGMAQMPMPPVGMARGGIAEAARLVASRGRHGDTMLAHITPSEARLLKARGGSGTINPETGLPEFFFKSVVRAVTNVVKGVGNVISGTFKNIGSAISKTIKRVVTGVKKVLASPLGKIVATVALATFLGPGAFGIQGLGLQASLGTAGVAALSSGVVTAAGGGNTKDILRSAATAYFAAPGGAVSNYVNSTIGAGAMGITNAAAAAAVNAGIVGVGTGVLSGQKLADAVKSGLVAGAISGGIAGAQQGFGAQVPTAGEQTTPATSRDAALQMPGGQTTAGGMTPAQIDDYLFNAAQVPPPGAATAGAPGKPYLSVYGDSGVHSGTNVIPDYSAPGTAARAPGSMDSLGRIGGGIADLAQGNFRQGFGAIKEGAGDLFFPGKLTDAQLANSEAFQQARDKGASYSEALRAASNQLNPGLLRSYGPLLAAGLGAMGSMGGFKQQPLPESALMRDFAERDASIPSIAEKPSNYYIQNLPGVVYDSAGRIIGSQSSYSPTATMADVQRSTASVGEQMTPVFPGYAPPAYALGNAQQVMQPYNTASMYGNLFSPMYGYQPIRRAAEGGIASLAQGGYPRRTGQISGPGTEKSDSIPAMLSDGEFVMTAKAVRGAGNGSRRAGAKKMYALMHQLERNASRG